MNSGTILRKLWVGLKLRCPHCEQGHTFAGLFRANRACSVCGYVFEIRDGESVGGMYINLGLAELLSLGGYLVVEVFYDFPPLPHIVFWATFNVLFLLLFYRHSRSMWMSISYLAGGAQEYQTGARQSTMVGDHQVVSQTEQM